MEENDVWKIDCCIGKKSEFMVFYNMKFFCFEEEICDNDILNSIFCLRILLFS